MRAFFVVLVLAWLGGITLGVAGAPVVAVWLIVAAIGLGVLRVSQVVQLAAAALMLVLLGYVWGGYSGASKVSGCGFESSVIGEVSSQPQIQAQRVLVVIKDEHGCQALVTMGRFSELEEGDMVELTGGQVQSLDDVRDYSAGYAGYLERRGISATWRYPHYATSFANDVASRGRPSKLWINKLHEGVRERVTSLFVEPDASVVLAVLLAEKGTLPERVVEQFRATGVSHVLAISGLHISLLTGMLLLVLMLLPVSPRVRTGVVVGWLWSYVIFIGGPTSAVRAAAFWTIALLALRFHVLVSLPTVLLLAATVLVTLDPLFLADVGFQLSISAVTGIFVVLFLTRSVMPRWFFRIFLVSLGAWVATGPVIAYHFGNVVLSGVVTNLLVVPLVPTLLILAIVALLLSLVFVPAAVLVAYLLHGIIAWVDFVTGVVAAVPGLFYEEVSVPVWVVFVYYLAVLAGCAVIMRYQRRSWREVWQ